MEMTVKQYKDAINVMSTEMVVNVIEFAKEAGVPAFGSKTKKADVVLVHDRMEQLYGERKSLVDAILKLGGKADMSMNCKDLSKLYRGLEMAAAEKMKKAKAPANGETPAAGNKTQGGNKNMKMYTEKEMKDAIMAALEAQEERMTATFEAKIAELLAKKEEAVAPAPEAMSVAEQEEALKKQDKVLENEFTNLVIKAGAATGLTREELKQKINAVMEARKGIQAKLAELTGGTLRTAANVTRAGTNVVDFARNTLIAVVNGTADGVNYVLRSAADGMDSMADYIDPKNAKAPKAEEKPAQA